MKWLVLAVLVLAQTLFAQTNVIFVPVGDYTTTLLRSNQVLVTLLSPNPRVVNGIPVKQDPMPRWTGTNGYAYYTNLAWGKYRCDLLGQQATPFTFYVGTNTLGLWNVALLITNANAIPPNPATNYYTKDQVDYLLANTGGGGSGATSNQVYGFGYLPKSEAQSGAFIFNLQSATGYPYSSLLGAPNVVTNNDSRAISLTNASNTFGASYVDLMDGAPPAWKQGRVFFDTNQNSLAVYNDSSNVTLNVGLEQYVKVSNKSGRVITNGTVVRASGAQGQLPKAVLAQANTEAGSQAIGIATEDIDNNGTGYVTTHGIVNDLNTSAFSDGDTLYLSATNAGVIVTNVPSDPNYAVVVGTCLYSHSQHGKILVSVVNQWVGQTSVIGLQSKIATNSVAYATNSGYADYAGYAEYVAFVTNRISFATNAESSAVAGVADYVNGTLTNNITLAAIDAAKPGIVTDNSSSVTITNLIVPNHISVDLMTSLNNSAINIGDNVSIAGDLYADQLIGNGYGLTNIHSATSSTYATNSPNGLAFGWLANSNSFPATQTQWPVSAITNAGSLAYSNAASFTSYVSNLDATVWDAAYLTTNKVGNLAFSNTVLLASVTDAGTAAYSNATAFAASSVTNLTAGQLAAIALAVTNNSTNVTFWGSNYLGNKVVSGYNCTISNALGIVALGTNSHASGIYSVAIGANARATGTGAVALGGEPNAGCTASGFQAVVLNNGVASGQQSLACNGATASGFGAIGLARSSTASGTDSATLGGVNSAATQQSSVAIGHQAQSTNAYSIVVNAGAGNRYSSTTNQITLAATNGVRILDGSLFVNAGASFGITNVSSNYSMLLTDYLVNGTTNNFTVTLPTAVGVAGKVYQVKNSGTGTITINTTSSQTIDGNASGTVTLGQYDAVTMVSDNSNWIITQ